ncbi:MAG: PilZ domain-containing protein [Candidatus Omnitrophica bacterium]|nr:PilZ domain-containing protein [Candidatus Omnitrophota bacterium]
MERGMIPLRTVRKKLGELLIERKIITPEQLQIALEEQKKKGGYLSQHLIALGFASELDIAMSLSNQYNFAYLPLKNYIIPSEVLGIIPLKWIKIYTLLPVDKVGNILSVAMADPLNEGVIQMLEQITNCHIQVFISTYTEINEAIDAYLGDKLKDLKEAYLDPRDLDKLRTTNEFIQTRAYAGPERREYVRIPLRIKISYYFHGKTFYAYTKDISYGGIRFISEVFIPIDTNLAVKLYVYQDRAPLDTVINILRVHLLRETEIEHDLVQEEGGYETAGCFEFMAGEDREVLVRFLKENIK